METIKNAIGIGLTAIFGTLIGMVALPVMVLIGKGDRWYEFQVNTYQAIADKLDIPVVFM